MTILAAIRREERKLEQQLGRLNHQLSGVRAAAKALGGSANRELTGIRKRALSAAGRAKIAAAARRRWAKVRAKARKMARRSQDRRLAVAVTISGGKVDLLRLISKAQMLKGRAITGKGNKPQPPSKSTELVVAALSQHVS